MNHRPQFNQDGPEIAYFQKHVERGQPALDVACGTGFTDIVVHGDHGEEAPTRDSEFVVFVARKP